MLRFAQQRQQALQGFLHVAHHRQAGCNVFINLAGVNVQLDNRFLTYITVAVARYAVAEAAAGNDEHIGIRNSKVRGDMTMHTRQAQGTRIRFRINADTHERVDYRQVAFLSQLHQLCLRTAVDCAAADQKHRLLRCVQHLGCLRQLLRRRLRQRLCLSLHLGLRPFQLLNLYAARNIHQHRAGTALLRQSKGLTQCRHQLLLAAYHHVIFRNRHRYADNIYFLKGVTSQHAYADLTGNCYQWNGVEISGRQTGDNVCCTRARGGNAHARFTAGSRIAVSRMNRALLMCGEHIFQRCAVQCVI